MDKKKLAELLLLDEELDSLSDRADDTVVSHEYIKRRWTETEDMLLEKYWLKKVQRDIARIMKRPLVDCIERYEYLREAKRKPQCDD